MPTVTKLLALTCLLAALTQVSEAQNLVPNPSFEDTISCPQWIGHFTVTDWVKPTWGSSDSFHSCSTGQLGVPQNEFGFQFARTGNGYVGAHGTGQSSGSNSREYIQCQLITPLEPGSLYEVSFWVSRADSSTWAVDNVGAYLSTTAITLNSANNLPYTPQVISPLGEPITDSENWVQIVDTILAEGGEQFLTIGVFADDSDLTWQPVIGGWHHLFQYYYDDVSVVKITPNSIRKSDGVQLVLFPNPTNDKLHLKSNSPVDECIIFNSIGQEIVHINIKSDRFEVDVSTFSPGLYYLKVRSGQASTLKKFIVNQ